MASKDEKLGRNASSPISIPGDGWKAILKRVKERFSEHRVTLVAGGLTYYTLLALFPAIGALVSVYGLVADPQTIQEQVQRLQGIVPSGALGVLESQLQRLTSQSGSSLSLAFVVSLLLSLWSARKGIKALFQAMNIAYEEDEERGTAKKIGLTLGFTLATIILVVVALGGIVILPTVLSVLPIASSSKWLVAGGSAALLAVLALVWLGALFKVGPNRTPAKAGWLAPGALFTFLGWIVASGLFSFYASNLKNFDSTYGSFSTVIVFLMWTWIMMIVILTGAELNAQVEHQVETDTTVGEEEGLGFRGARMADRVAG